MQFATWEPVYRAILEDFGFSSALDEEAANLLHELLCHKEQSLSIASERLRGHDVMIVGNAPTLKEELENLREKNIPFVAADGATAVLLEEGIVPEIVVTDLDGPFDAILEANQMGAIATVHAHGDNIDALKRCVPQLRMILGTVQCRPPQGLYNFGGFTDGDRCVFLAKELGAASIKLLGFDFEDESVTPRKRKKLAWARRLIDLALSENSEQSILVLRYEIKNRIQRCLCYTFSVHTGVDQNKTHRLKGCQPPEIIVHRLQEPEPLELLSFLTRLYPLQSILRVQSKEQSLVGLQIPGTIDASDPLHRIRDYAL